MYVKHFLKMLLGLILMAAIGIGGLFLADYYSKKTGGTDSGNVLNSLKGK